MTSRHVSTPAFLRRLLGLVACGAAMLSLRPAAAQVTATWNGANGNMATASNWSTGLVPSAAAGDTMQFAGSGVSTLTFPGTTFSSNSGLGGLLVTSGRTTALSITNAGPSSGSGAVFRLRPDAAVTIEAGAGAFSFGASGTSFFLNLGATGANRFTNNSANLATLGPQVSINASTGTNGRATFDGSGDWLISGAFTAALSRGLVKEGTGLLTLSGNNAFASDITLSGGTLRLEGNGRLGGGSFANAIANDARFEFAGSLDQTLSGVISGTGLVAVTGPGRLTLSGSNSFSGGTTLAGGTLRLGNSSGLGSGTLTIDGGSLDASAASLTMANAQTWNAGFGFVGSQSLTMSGGVTLTADIPLDVAASRLTISGSIADASANRGLTKTGAGILALSGSNSYGGQTSIAAGTLSIASTAALPGWDQTGRYSVAGGATLAVTAGVSDADVATLLGTGNFAANAAIGYDTTAGSRTLATAIADTPAGPLGLTKVGNNTLTLTAANTFTGPATVATGTLDVGSGGSLAADVSVASGAWIQFNDSAAQAYAGGITGAGQFAKTGSGTLTLTGASSFTGRATLAGGRLVVADGTFGSPTGGFNLNVGNGRASLGPIGAAALRQTGGTVSVGDFGGQFVVGVDGVFGGYELAGGTLRSVNGGGTYRAGVRTGTFFQTGGSIEMSGLGLGGQSLDIGSTEAGAAGTVYVTGGSATLEASTNTANSIRMLSTNPTQLTIAGTGDWNATGRVQVGDATNNAAALNLVGSGRLTAATITTAGGANNRLNFNGGTLRAAESTSAFLGGFTAGNATIHLGGGTIDTSGFDVTVSQVLSAPTGDGLASIPVDAGGSGYVAAPIISITGGGGSGATAVANFDAATGSVTGITITNPGTGYTSAPTVAILTPGFTPAVAAQLGTPTLAATASGGLTKTGLGTLTLTGQSTFTGPATVTAGTLALGTGGGLAADISLAAGTRLALTTTGTSTYSGSVSGLGQVVHSGSGVTTLSGTNLYSGGTTISGGVLAISSTAALPGWNQSGSYSVQPGGTLAVVNAVGDADVATILTTGNFTSGGVIGFDTAAGNRTYAPLVADTPAGPLGLTKLGNNTLTLTANNTFTGPATVRGGTLQLGDGGTTGSLPGDVVTNATLAFNRSDDITFAGAISGSGGITKLAANTLTLTTANTYTGTTTISAGTVVLSGGANRLGTAGQLAFANVAGARLELAGNDQEVFALSGGGTTGGAVVNSSATPSVLTLRRTSGNITYTGSIDGNIRLEVVGSSPLNRDIRQVLNSTTSSYTGGTLVDNGSLLPSNDRALGAVPEVLDPANITLRNGGLMVFGNVANQQFAATRGILLGPGGGGLEVGFNNSVTLNGPISGDAAASLTIPSNSGTLILTANNTFAGPLDVRGRLQVGTGGTTGTLGTGSVEIGTGGQIIVNRAGEILVPNLISGGGTIVKQGSGTLVLSGSNPTYTGTATVSGGTLRIETGDALGTTAGNTTIGNAGLLAVTGGISSPEPLVLSGQNSAVSATRITNLGGTNTLSGAISLNSGGTDYRLRSDAGSLRIEGTIARGTATGTLTLRLGGAAAGEIAGAINGADFTLGLVKEDSGSWSLTAANTHTGPTTVSGGTLRLDFAAVGAPAAQILPSGNAVTLAGGSLALVGAATGTTTQTLGGLSLNGGYGSVAVSSGPANTTNLALGAITRTSQGTVDFVLPASGSITTTTANTSGNILGAWATVGGSDWAVSAGDGTTPGAITAFTGYVADAWAPGNATTVTGDSSPAADSETGSLRFAAPAATTVTLAGTNTISSGGLLVASTVGANTSTLAGGTLTGPGGSDLFIQQLNPAAPLLVTASLADGGSATGLVKAGPGSLTLAAANSFTGGTTVTTGTLLLGDAAALGTAAATITGGLLDLGGQTIANSVVVNGGTLAGGTINIAQVTPTAGTIAATLGGTGGLSKSGTGTVTLAAANTFTGTTSVSAGTLLLAHSSALAASQVTSGGIAFDAGVAPAAYSFGGLSGSGSILLENTAGGPVALTVGGDNAGTEFRGVLSGAGSLVKAGSGQFNIRGTQTYAGETIIQAGTILLGGSAAPSTTRQLPIGTVVTVASEATLLINGLGGSSTNNEIVGGLQGAGTVTTSNGGTIARLTIRNDADYTFTGSFTSSDRLLFFKEGAGTQTLTGASTASGSWTITAGTLRIENNTALGGTAGTTTIGDPQGSAAVLALAGGITSAEPLLLAGRGDAATATRVANAGGSNTLTGAVTLNTGGDQYGLRSDSGSLRVAGTIARGTATGTRTLRLGGAAAGEIAGGIDGSDFTLGLVKEDAGTWTIASTSSHSGPTTVAAGTLLVNGSLANTSAVSVAAGGVLGGSGSLAAALAGAGLVSPGNSPGILTAPQVDPSAGTGYAFEFTGTGSPAYGSPTASLNDVLRLTDVATPFTTALTGANVIDVYFDVSTLTNGDTFRGGFYTDLGTDFLPSISDATYAYWVRGDGFGGDRSFGGQSYYSLASFDSGLSVTLSTVAEAANFGGGTINGQVTQFAVVPEPGSLALAGLALAALAAAHTTRRHRRQSSPPA